MVNSRKFNEEQVLDNILHTFWRKGFEATSLDDLIEATGVKRQSLYNAFGNKDDMFLKAYERYLDHINETVMAATHNSDASLSEAVRTILDAFAGVVIDPNTPAGCFITNTAVEFGDQQSSDITCRLKQHFKQIEENLHDMLEQAQQEGKLASDRDPRAIAQFLVASVTSIAVMYRLNKDKAFIKNALSEMLHVLD